MKAKNERENLKLLGFWANPQIQAQVQLLKDYMSSEHKINIHTSELFRKLLRDAVKRAALDGTETNRSEEVRI